MNAEGFRIGTCGYSYDDWRDVFYPKDLRQNGYLRFYSLVFPFVELDFSWYAMPKPDSLQLMAEQVSPGFLFSLKAHRSLTHEIGPDWETSVTRFSEAADALHSRNRLAAVLLQLPFSFHYTADNRRYLGDLCTALSAFPLVVEFRNEAWYLPRVIEELARRKITLAMLDRPELPGLPPETDIMTSPTVYYRLHGRNSSQWWNGDAISRYDYDYSAEELKERARSLVSLSKKADQVFVAFNNHAKGHAVRNAQALTALIKTMLF